MFRDSARRILVDCDASELAPFEKGLFSAVCEQRHHNMAFVVLVHDLRTMIPYKACAGSWWNEIPHWLSRTWDNGDVRITQLRQSANGFSDDMIPHILVWPLHFESEWLGCLSFNVQAALTECRIRGLPQEHVRRSYGNAAAEVQPGIVCDERSYWTSQRNVVSGQLAAMADEVLEIVNTGGFVRNVIVPSVHTCNRTTLGSISLSTSYGTVLAYANGLRVNDLVILSTINHPTRVFETPNGAKFFQVAEADCKWYAAELIEGRLRDTLWEFNSANVHEHKRLDVDIVELCLQNIRQPRKNARRNPPTD